MTTATSKPALFETLLKTMRGAVTGSLVSVFVDAEPRPASRPRFTKWGGIHYAPTYVEFYAACQTQLAKIKTDHRAGDVVVALEFVHTRARTSKLTTPRADVDNLAKGPMDAMTKVEKVWRDDTQVTDLIVSKRFANKGETPGVHIHYGSIT